MKMGRYQGQDEGKLLGVCAHVGRRFGIDPLLVRVALVLVTLMGAWPWTVIGYGVGAWYIRKGGGRATDRASLEAREAARERMRSLDLRMQAVETYVTSSNSRLAREIEELR